MSTVTTYLNLVKPAPLENFSRATYNNNLDLTDNSYARALLAPGVNSLSSVTWGASLGAGALAGKNFVMLPESSVVTGNASGFAMVTMPYTFQTGYLVVSAVNGDENAAAGVYVTIGGNTPTNNPTNNKFGVRVLLPGGAPGNGTVCRINYMVIGY